MDNLEFIKSQVSREDMLYLLAEESSELAQAALKLARKMKGSNPTPKSIEECTDDYYEEIVDVTLCLYMLDYKDHIGDPKYFEMFDRKIERWAERLRGDNDGVNEET